MTQEDEIRASVSGVLSGNQFSSLWAKSQTPQVKEQLKQHTAEAISRGAFGAPFFWVRNKQGKEEPFFGSDRFDHIAHFLNEPHIVWFGHNPEVQIQRLESYFNNKSKL
jgi:2-hydroxychromene-2-carboxylate isomerase